MLNGNRFFRHTDAETIRDVVTRRTVVWATVNSALAGSTVIVMIMPWLDTLRLLLSLCFTTVLAAIAVRHGLRQQRLVDGVICTIWACVCAGLVNGVAIFIVAATQPMGAAVGRFGVAWVGLGPILAPVLGALFGMCFAVPVGYAHKLRRYVTIDAPERTGLLQCAVSLGLSICLASLFALHRHHALAWLAVALFIGSTLGLFWFNGRRFARSVWLRRVRDGEVSDWSVVQVTEVNPQDVAALVPVSLPRSSPLTAALVQRMRTRGVAPYRQSHCLVPRALVALRPSPSPFVPAEQHSSQSW